MKKLMMCVAAVVSACALNAASVNWSVGDLFNQDFDSLAGTVTLASGSFTSTGTISGNEATGAFSGFTWGDSPFSTGSAWTITAKVQAENGDLYEKVINTTLGTVDVADDRTGPAAFLTLGQDATASLLPDGYLDITDLASAGWTKSGGGVPEPTSGLLLVLGGAMLALRRRRA